MYKKLEFLPILLFSVLFLGACASIRNSALNSVGKMFTGGQGGGNSFTKDNDPALVEAALPTFLKTLELMRDASPESPDLHFAVGQISTMYAGGFLQPKAERQQSHSQKRRELARAKNLYLRGQKNILKGLRLRLQNSNFEAEFSSGNLDKLIGSTTEAEIPFLYWYALSSLAALSLDPIAPELLAGAPKALLFLFRVLQLDPQYQNGALHSTLVTVISALPPSIIAIGLSTSPELIAPFHEQYYQENGIDPSDQEAVVRYHFEKAKTLDPLNPAPYIGMAKWVKGHQKSAQDKTAFREYLNRALEIDPSQSPDNQLMIILAQNEAEFLLQNIDDFFL